MVLVSLYIYCQSSLYLVLRMFLLRYHDNVTFNNTSLRLYSALLLYMHRRRYVLYGTGYTYTVLFSIIRNLSNMVYKCV